MTRYPLWLALTAAFISGAFPLAALAWLVGSVR